MCRLVCYVSTLNSETDLNEVKSLFDFVSIRNAEMKLTGVLFFSDNNFLQILEGDFDTVGGLFDKIEKDNMHHDVIKIIDEDETKRMFDNYFFGFLTVTSSEDKQWMNFFLEKECEPQNKSQKVVVELMKKFLQRFQPIAN